MKNKVIKNDIEKRLGKKIHLLDVVATINNGGAKLVYYRVIGSHATDNRTILYK